MLKIKKLAISFKNSARWSFFTVRLLLFRGKERLDHPDVSDRDKRTEKKNMHGELEGMGEDEIMARFNVLL
jgi:hypothetical protein